MRSSQDTTRTRSPRQVAILPLPERIIIALQVLRAWERLAGVCEAVLQRRVSWSYYLRTAAPYHAELQQALPRFVEAWWAPSRGWVWPPVGELPDVCADVAGYLKQPPRDAFHPYPAVTRWRLIKRALPREWSNEAWLVRTYGETKAQ